MGGTHTHDRTNTHTPGIVGMADGDRKRRRTLEATEEKPLEKKSGGGERRRKGLKWDQGGGSTFHPSMLPLLLPRLIVSRLSTYTANTHQQPANQPTTAIAFSPLLLFGTRRKDFQFSNFRRKRRGKGKLVALFN